MSRRVGNVAVICPEPPRTCTVCGKTDECRPYGKGGADICHPCSQATPEAKAECDRQMMARLVGMGSA